MELKKLNPMLGLLVGVFFLAVAITWWAVMPRSPDRLSSTASAHRASLPEPDSISENQTRPSAPQDLATPKLTAEVSGEDTLERRCLQLAQHDPRAAVILASETADTHAGLLENLTAQWAMHDLQASHEWVQQQQPGERREGLLARVAFVGSQSDPVAAARIVTEEMTPGQRQTEAAISVLHQWALRDLEGAAAWALAFPEGAPRQRAMGEIEGIRKVLRTGGP